MTPLERVTRVIDEVRGVKSQYGINEWSWGLLVSLQQRAPTTLTERQEKCLTDIERKVFGDE